MSNVTIKKQEPVPDIARANQLLSQLRDFGFSGMELEQDGVVIYVSIEELVARIFQMLSSEIGTNYEIDWEKKRIKFKVPLNLVIQNITK